MTNNFTPIFNYIDEPRKFAGLTLVEIISVGIVAFIGFALDKVVVGLIGCFFTLYVTRYIEDLTRTYLMHRFLFFHLSDLVSVKKNKLNIFAKYFI